MDFSKIFQFKLDFDSPYPVYEQIKNEIKFLINAGELAENQKLPAIRELASILKVNQNTIIKVYYQLDIEGYVYSKKGSGYFIKLTNSQQEDNKIAQFDLMTRKYIKDSFKLGFSGKEIKETVASVLNNFNGKDT